MVLLCILMICKCLFKFYFKFFNLIQITYLHFTHSIETMFSIRRKNQNSKKPYDNLIKHMPLHNMLFYYNCIFILKYIHRHTIVLFNNKI